MIKWRRTQTWKSRQIIFYKEGLQSIETTQKFSPRIGSYKTNIEYSFPYVIFSGKNRDIWKRQKNDDKKCKV